MQPFSTAPPATPLTGGLADALFDRADREPGLPLISRRPDGGGPWARMGAAEVRDEVVGLAKGFVTSGVRPGARIAIMARTRYEWTVLCLALWTVGAEVVPVHPTSSRDQVEWILGDADCVGVVVEDEQGAMTVGSVCGRLPRLRHVWQLDDGVLARLTEGGTLLPRSTVDSLRRIVPPDSTAVIAYTSGTSGRPRGCVLTHRGLASPCDTLLAGWGHTAAPPGTQPAVLALLPFSHIYGLLVQGLCLRGGMLMGYEPEPVEETLAADLLSFRPTFVYAVPSVFEKLYKTMLRQAEEAGRGPLFERAVRTAREYATAAERQRLGRGHGPGTELRLQHAFYERTVYRKLRAALGGRVCGAASGGSALGRELALFYSGIGILVHDGYGLTETGGGVTAQPVGREKFGTVGRPLPGTEIRVADDGEVLVRGPSVFEGYVGDDRATQTVLRDGWLATGDTGRLDAEGYLSITGRKKDVIVTSGGKSVAPAPLEERLRVHPLVHQAVVVGDDRPCVGALITLDPAFLAHWRRVRSGRGDTAARDGRDAEDVREEQDGREERDEREEREENALRQEIRRAVTAANSSVSRAESIRVFRILPEPFDAAGGLLTPSMKLRRDAIVRRYAEEIDAMYTASARTAREPLPDVPVFGDDADDVFRRVR